MGRIARQLKLSKLKQSSLHSQCVSTGGGSTCTDLLHWRQLKASTFQKTETTMILLDSFDTVAGAH